MTDLSPSAPEPTDGHPDHVRAEPRDSMFLMATIRRPGGPDMAIKVRNLSAGGMMAEVPASFARGEAIEAELRGIGTIGGTVAWAAGGRIGVAFARPVDPHLARKPVAPAAPPPLAQLVRVSRQTWRPGLR